MVSELEGRKLGCEMSGRGTGGCRPATILVTLVSFEIPDTSGHICFRNTPTSYSLLSAYHSTCSINLYLAHIGEGLPLLEV